MISFCSLVPLLDHLLPSSFLVLPVIASFEVTGVLPPYVTPPRIDLKSSKHQAEQGHVETGEETFPFSQGNKETAGVNNRTQDSGEVSAGWEGRTQTTTAEAVEGTQLQAVMAQLQQVSPLSCRSFLARASHSCSNESV